MYAMFGYLFINMGLLVCIIIVLSIVFTYLSLNSLNHEWWWRAFWVGGSGPVYMFFYLVYYMIYVLEMDMFAGEVIYLIYSFNVCMFMSLMLGSISVASSWLFLNSIYKNAKSD